MSERDVQRSRAAQVGVLMRAYRETFASERGRRGLTQEELLRRMGAVESDYAERYSHATVSRWESGVTRPTVQRLLAFGKALDLSTSEVAGLILLAGLAPDFQAATDRATRGPGDVSPSEADESEEPNSVGIEPAASDGTADSPGLEQSSTIDDLGRFLILRCLPLGMLIVGGGYAFSIFAGNESWVPTVYVGLVSGLVLIQGFMWPSRRYGLREFFWISIFFLLTTPFLQFAPIRLDHYNLALVLGVPGSLWAYMLGLVINFAMSAGAGLMFHLLWKWQYSSSRGSRTALRRAVWVVLPPVLVVYGILVVITNISIVIQLAFLFPVFSGVFTLLLFLRDPQITLSERDQRFLLSTMVALSIVWSTLGIFTVVAIYLSPDLPTVLPDHNLLTSWEIDFAELGLSREEALERVNLGYMWHSMCVFAYMFFIVGGNVFVSIYKAGSGSRGDSMAENRVIARHIGDDSGHTELDIAQSTGFPVETDRPT